MALEALKAWFQNQARDLPWRHQPSAYAVWISEVMLQQTQVAVVIPYFERWMQQFPTVEQLAAAPLDSVIKAWEGLGYYSRARNLHAAAKQIMECFGGQLPEDELSLRSIKGLGPYTVGAIRAFAFRQKAAAVDGNVLRVLSRYLLIEEDLSKPKVVEQIRQKAYDLLPDFEPWVTAEALIELGATVCTRSPQCHRCPLQSACKAYAAGMAQQLPNKGKKVATELLFRAVALVLAGEQVLVRRCQKGEIMSDLHEFPFVDLPKGKGAGSRDVKNRFETEWGMSLHVVTSLSEVKHTFTRYRATLFPTVFETAEPRFIPGYFWTPVECLPFLAFSSGHRQLMQSLLQVKR